MKNLAIYGNNYLEVVKLISEINLASLKINLLGFLNDLPKYQGKSFAGYPVLGGKEVIENLKKDKKIAFFHNINSTIKDRKKVAKILRDYDCELVSLMHPSVNLFESKVGKSAIIPQGCVVGYGAEIGDFLTARFSAVISHDVKIGNFVYLGPNATICGYSEIEDDVFIGASATVLPKVKIGKGSVIGAGSLVNKDIPTGVIAYGIPAKIMGKKINDSYRGRGM